MICAKKVVSLQRKIDSNYMRKIVLILFAFCNVLHAENWTGTGWALKNGHIVTNCHCVEGANSIIVRGVIGNLYQEYKAKVVAIDISSDLAIIKICDEKFQGFGEIPYSIERKQCEIGETVWTLGYPMMDIMGEDVKFTDGKISAKTGFQGDLQTYQITVPIQPGNSGGALFNKYGKVVGITSSGFKKTIADNVNYAIKTNYLINLIESKIGLDILPQGSMASIPLTEQIKKASKFVFPLFFSDISTAEDVFQIISKNPSPPTMQNGHEAIDLGLTVKWATKNIGSSAPEEYGSYFSWGEIIPKTTLDWENYKWYNMSSGIFTKYNNTYTYGHVDNKTILDTSDDAARINWGGSWRIPTKEEVEELYNYCIWTWIDIDGVKGYKVTSKVNGNSIFLPAAGYFRQNILYTAGTHSVYWLNLLNTDDPDYSLVSEFNMDYMDITNYERYYGLPIRPVCP